MAFIASYIQDVTPEVPDSLPSSPAKSGQLSVTQLFAFADMARDRSDYVTAEAAYRALAANPSLELRSEARFRLAMMLAYQQHKLRDAAVELRKILDETPHATRVRLELARIDILLGRVNAAGRELRGAQADGLPPAVERVVRFYAQALDARRSVGGSLEVAIAPDSNVNRATTSSTLGTVIGDFVLDQNAKAHSGIGVTARGQGFVRLPLTGKISLLARLSGSANVYRSPAFDDLIVAPQIGPEITMGKGRLNLAVGSAWRWYGAVPYSLSLTANANWQHPWGKRSQWHLDAGYAAANNRRDDLQSGHVWTLATGADRAFSARFGGGMQASVARQAAHDPGYATTGGGLNVYLFREVAKITIALNAAYNHLEADQRLLLFPERRIDNTYSAGISGTFRQVRVGSVAPIVRFRIERNVSTVKLYDYRRTVGEVGIATAF